MLEPRVIYIANCTCHNSPEIKLMTLPLLPPIKYCQEIMRRAKNAIRALLYIPRLLALYEEQNEIDYLSFDILIVSN